MKYFLSRLSLVCVVIGVLASSVFGQGCIPLLTASRHTNDSSIVYTSAGIGDSSVTVQGWIWDPKEKTGGNIQLGIGLLFPTRKDNVMNTVDSGGKIVTVPVDYSIQPGQGAFGIPLEWSAFKNWKSSQFYFNGSYTMMTGGWSSSSDLENSRLDCPVRAENGRCPGKESSARGR